MSRIDDFIAVVRDGGELSGTHAKDTLLRQLVVHIACRDGVIDPAEASVLERVFPGVDRAALEDEIGRVLRSRVVNPKWITGVMRHGYKGAFEMAATVDYMFAFAATTGAVRDHHFDLVEAAFLEDDTVRDFIATHNAPALTEMAARLQEAIDRGLWQPRSNSARAQIAGLLGS